MGRILNLSMLRLVVHIVTAWLSRVKAVLSVRRRVKALDGGIRFRLGVRDLSYCTVPTSALRLALYSLLDIQNVIFHLCSRLLFYSASHSRVAPENVGLQKKQKYNTFACHTCNEVRLCVLGIRKKEVGKTKR
jgi:hypothetical protein